ncbi:histone-lysine N-methyltransferase SETMAR-like [Trichonephila clavipes]|nr:histone-lysine N-methyltransferase SETMAR-like [Trichonephila clavipes]
MEVSKGKIQHILQFFFDKGENASQAAEIVYGVYGSDTVNCLPVLREILASSIPFRIKKKLDWVQHQLQPKNMMDRISICEALAERNKIDPFLKRMVTEGEKWVTYENIVGKRSWSKRGEAAQTVAKPGLTAMKLLLCIW